MNRHIPHYLGFLAVTIIASLATLFLTSRCNEVIDETNISTPLIQREAMISDRQLVLNYYLKDKSKGDLELYFDRESRATEPVFIDIVSVATDTKAALLSESHLGGAYNIPGILYLIQREGGNRIVKMATLIDTNGTTTTKRSQERKTNEEYWGGMINAGFDPEDNSFHITGFRAFGLFPCNDNEKYQFFNDRFILTSISQAKGCKGIEIDDPVDIPNDFDATPVEIYKVSPEILKLAQKAKII